MYHFGIFAEERRLEWDIVTECQRATGGIEEVLVLDQKKMENEQKKEFLMSYQLAKRDVTRLEEQLAEVRIGEMSPGCEIGDGLPHAHNVTDLSEYAVKVEEIEQKIIKARYRRICAFEQVRDCIEAMDDEREKLLLTYRYLRGMRWTAICELMKHSWQHIHRIHASALKNFRIM